LASASASGNARALPVAITGLGRGGTALGFGIASGANGGVTATGIGINSSSPGRVGTVRAFANAPVPAGAMGAVEGQGQAAIAASLPMLKPNTTLNSFASAIGDPLLSDVLATSFGKPNVLAGLAIDQGGNQLGLASLGGLYPSTASGASTIYNSSAEFMWERTGLLDTDLRVGLQDGQATGQGFDSLDFTIIEDGSVILDQLFTSLSSASAFFDDRVLDLGFVSASSSPSLDLEFDLMLTAHNPGDGFAIDLAVAAVPEPPGWPLLAAALAIAYSLRRKGRQEV
jgi:hypothetical protein